MPATGYGYYKIISAARSAAGTSTEPTSNRAPSLAPEPALATPSIDNAQQGFISGLVHGVLREVTGQLTDEMPERLMLVCDIALQTALISYSQGNEVSEAYIVGSLLMVAAKTIFNYDFLGHYNHITSVCAVLEHGIMPALGRLGGYTLGSYISSKTVAAVCGQIRHVRNWRQTLYPDNLNHETHCLRDYVTAWSQKAQSYEQALTELRLSVDEESLFKEFICPITQCVPNIPVFVHGRLYDYVAIKRISEGDHKNPFRGDAVYPRDIQPARIVAEKIETLISELRARRDQAEQTLSYQFAS